ncbi:hypothetical protein ACI48J_12575 [Paenibacillus chitinolyticus]|uniref:hypothetical protein n=1 Tax=Paenibacillus chitinolyticus TaxID=79263 RepID=UPI00386A0E27
MKDSKATNYGFIDDSPRVIHQAMFTAEEAMERHPSYIVMTGFADQAVLSLLVQRATLSLE